MIKKLIRIQLLILCFSFIAFSSYSQNIHDAKLIGGMYLNAGYLKSIDDIALGIGGKLTFKVCNNFRMVVFIPLVGVEFWESLSYHIRNHYLLLV